MGNSFAIDRYVNKSVSEVDRVEQKVSESIYSAVAGVLDMTAVAASETG